MSRVMALSVSLAFVLFACLLAYAVAVDHSIDAFGLVLLGLTLGWAVIAGLLLALHRTGRRDLASNLWLALVSASVAYLVLDVIAGSVLIRPVSPPFVGDAVVHHRLNPNTLSQVSRPDYVFRTRVNALGLRGTDVPTRKAAGTVRILMLGDSFTFGAGVNDNETFSFVLQNRLASQTPGESRRIEVLNAGVDSYTPILAYLLLRDRLSVVEPDFVVFNFDMSDLVQEEAYRGIATLDQAGQVVAIDGRDEYDFHGMEEIGPPGFSETSLSGRIRRRVNRRMFLTRWALFNAMSVVERLIPRLAERRSLDQIVELADPALLEHTLVADSHDRESQWANIFESILRIRDYSEEIGAEFVLTTYPWGHQVNSREWESGRHRYIPAGAQVSDRSLERLRAFAVENEIEFVDAFPRFRAYDGDSLLYFKQDMHWTPVGHRLMADVLSEHLLPRILADSVGRN